MSHIVKIRYWNWGPFRGEQSIDVGPEVYGVVCRYAGNAGRSNWGGKTWFMGGIRFAMTGIKPGGPNECRTEDDWITRGEDDGGVEVTLSCGTRIKRSRIRGKRNELQVWPQGGPVCRQARAQERIDAILKMTAKDFDGGVYVAQGQVARFVLAPPAEKTRQIESWFQLGKLREAEAVAARHQAAAQVALDKAVAVRESARAGLQDAQGLKALHVALEKAKGAQAAAQTAVDAGRAAVTGMKDHQEHSRRNAKFDRVVAEGQALAEKLGGLKTIKCDALNRVAEDAARIADALHDKHVKLSGLVAKDFDGVCPVTCLDCPNDRATMVGYQAQRREELTLLTEKHDQAVGVADEAEEAHGKALDHNAAIASDEAKLVQLRAEADELRPSVAYIEQHGEPDVPDVAQLATQLANAATDVRDAQAGLECATGADKRFQSAAQDVEAAQADVRVWADTGRILAAARRNVALHNLRKVEDLANGILAGAGIDLTVEARWEREAVKGLAAHCADCGEPFPVSERVKECEACEAPRGRKIIEELELVSGARSGAADDSVGLAFQMAAASWFMQSRGSNWGVLQVDEPFGQLDAVNARRLSNRLHGLVSRDLSFEQGFVVAHDADIMAAMPARIVIERDGDVSTLRVE